MDEAFWWNLGVQAAVALGTVGAAVVALFGAAWRAKFFPPQLRLSLLNAAGEFSPMTLTLSIAVEQMTTAMLQEVQTLLKIADGEDARHA